MANFSSSFFRPKRGKKATAETQNIILKPGELFFEYPDTGIGTGSGKVKMGDGSTPYKDLPYFLDNTGSGGGSTVTVDVDDSIIEFTDDASTDNTELLNKVVSGAKLKVIIAAIKKLLSNINTSIGSYSSSITNLTNTVNSLNNSVTSINNMAKNNKYNIESMADDYINKMRIDRPLVYTTNYRITINNTISSGGSYGTNITSSGVGLNDGEEIISIKPVAVFANATEAIGYIIYDSDLRVLPEFNKYPSFISFDLRNVSGASVHVDHVLFELTIVKKRLDSEFPRKGIDFSYTNLYE